MPIGTTKGGVTAKGGIVIVYYMEAPDRPIFLMGQETNFLKEIHKDTFNSFKSKADENIFDAFLSPGSIENEEDANKAKAKFATICQELESADPTMGHITFADFKNSNNKAGNISAKPRCVKPENAAKYGFTKGGYETSDPSIDDTVVRECRQETGIEIDLARLKETKIKFTKTDYILFLYKLTKAEYDTIISQNILDRKNAEYENELHNIGFRRIPISAASKFFINDISKEVYNKSISDILTAKFGGKRNTKRSKKSKSGSSYKNRR